MRTVTNYNGLPPLPADATNYNGSGLYLHRPHANYNGLAVR